MWIIGNRYLEWKQGNEVWLSDYSRDKVFENIILYLGIKYDRLQYIVMMQLICYLYLIGIKSLLNVRLFQCYRILWSI